MPETSQIIFSFKEVVAALIKAHGIHDGIWGLYVNFGISASNAGPNEEELRPIAMIPILQIGLQRFEKETSLSVDAARVNPKPIQSAKSRRALN